MQEELESVGLRHYARISGIDTALEILLETNRCHSIVDSLCRLTVKNMQSKPHHISTDALDPSRPTKTETVAALERPLQYVFVMGNKRSGTSLLVRLLNTHPELFMTHESEILWLLYCFEHDLPFEKHPEDGFMGAAYTLKMARHLFTKDRSVPEIFEEVQRLLLTTGSPWLPPAKKERILFLGDKKPVQMTDERLFQYALQHFPGCKFIHVMRDPVDWFVSYHNNVMEKKRNVHKLFAFWLRNEQRVISFRQRAEICSFTYEALCNQTETILKRVFEFLGLQSDLCDLKMGLFRVFSGCPADPCAVMQFLWDRYRPLRSLA